IDRARPYFMGFIGERYGWVPEKDKYDAAIVQEQPWLEEHRGGKSVTELEMLHGVLNNPAMAGRAFFYFRDSKWSGKKGGAYLSEGTQEKSKLEELKDRIRKSGYPVVENYPSPEALAERVKEDLWRLIDEAFPENEVPDALVQERMRHEQFAASRLGLYLGGEGYFAALDAAMSAEPCRPVLVTGASGGGKSALLANWSSRWIAQNPNSISFFHYLGVGSDAADFTNLCRRFLAEITPFSPLFEPLIFFSLHINPKSKFLAVRRQVYNFLYYMFKPLSISLLFVFGCFANADEIKGNVVSIANADTITFLDASNSQHKIRFDGIDAPEKGQNYGTKATEALKATIRQNAVRVVTSGKDKCEREIGTVFVGNKNINEWLVENGSAGRHQSTRDSGLL
ncbi:MAG: thermonuclease family protein, partial [Verrucomicrobia bacterium]|nr:thermonuclease family protein [Verrucomicrobiota bacterium]